VGVIFFSFFILIKYCKIHTTFSTTLSQGEHFIRNEVSILKFYGPERLDDKLYGATFSNAGVREQ